MQELKVLSNKTTANKFQIPKGNKAGKRKTNPNNIPLARPITTVAEYNKLVDDITKEVRQDAVNFTLILVFYVLKSKFGMCRILSKALWDEIEKQSRMIADGYMTISQLSYELEKDYHIKIVSK